MSRVRFMSPYLKGGRDTAKLTNRARYIATRPGAHCAPRMHAALGTTEQGAVRFSFSCYNTAREVDAAVAAVQEIAR